MTVVKEKPESELDTAIATLDEAIQALKDDDTGAHWEDKTIEAARLIYAEDRPLFQRKRTELKKANKESQITEWTKHITGGGESEDDTTRADEIVSMVKDCAELFHDSESNCYATFDQKGHRETWPTGSEGFADWVSFKAYTELGFAVSETTLKQAVTALNGLAKFEGRQIDVWLRCAPVDNGYIIDLTNDDWQAIKVTPDEWKLINNPSTRFIRSRTATPLPIPEKGKGNIGLLWKYANIPDENARLLTMAFLMESWRTDTPFPVLMLGGEQGSAKSSTHTWLRQLTDPNSVPLRAAPKTTEDIFVSAGSNWVASFENMSNLKPDMQDALCTLATGGGFAKRKLYSDADESVIEVKRPVIINGISEVVTRPDLIDRMVKLNLPKIAGIAIEDKKLQQGFESDRPYILAGLLDLFSATLNALPLIELRKPPRMVSFAKLGEAMAATLNKPAETFTGIFSENRRDSLAHSLDASPVALAVQAFAEDVQSWSGPLKDLKKKLDNQYHQEGEGWPKSPRGMSEILRRLAPALRAHEVEIEFLGHKRDGQHLRIYLISHFSEWGKDRHNRHTVTGTPENIPETAIPSLKCDDVTNVTVKSANRKNPEKDIPPGKQELNPRPDGSDSGLVTEVF